MCLTNSYVDKATHQQDSFTAIKFSATYNSITKQLNVLEDSTQNFISSFFNAGNSAVLHLNKDKANEKSCLSD